MPMDTEIARSFLDWSNEEVVKWLSTLLLSQDYSSQFRDHLITGETLIRLNPGALDELKITEGADRVKILQHITTMRADLLTESPLRRVRSPVKHRRFSESITRTSYNSPNHRLQKPMHRQSISAMERTISPVKRVHTPIRESSPRLLSSGEGAAASPFLHNSPDSLSLESPISSGMSSPAKLRSRDVSPHDIIGLDKKEREFVNKLKATATLRSHNMKRISRSLEGLFQGGEDIFSLEARADHQDNCNSRLVEILKEENAALKRELETYYQRVRKLQKLEQEIEHIREGHRMLEASAARREKLEGALRSKLEKQVRNHRGEIIHLKAELHRAKKDTKTDTKNGESSSPSRSREIRRRDTMIMRLIKQNQESAAAREQLEKDLHSTRIQLRERTEEREETNPGEADSRNEKFNSETEKHMTQVYAESIEKLKSVLSAMQNMSQKREKLEKHLRSQLLTEISRLKGGSNKSETGSNGLVETKAELVIKVATLEADLHKWEQKCLELVAEKQMVLEAAVIPRDSRVEHLERTVSEQTITIQELYQQRSSYVSQLTDTNKRLAELETKLASLRVSVNEKDAVIQALQHSFLDPDELSQDDYRLSSSPVLHHSPVAAKKIGFPIGSQIDIDGTVSLPGNISDYPPYPQFSPSPPMRHRVIPNGNYHVTRGHTNESLSPVRRYADHNPFSSRSLSPVKRSSLERGAPVYMVKDPASAYTSSNVDYSPGNRSSHSPHYSRLNYPLPVSNSAPNSPNTRSVTRKPRISHPNLHFLQVPNSESSQPPPNPQNFPIDTSKSCTSPGGLKRNQSKPPISPGGYERAGKSKTPPPNYKLVSFSSSSQASPAQTNRGANVTRTSSKQRHHSVDDILCEEEKLLKPKHPTSAQNGSMELFNSLVGGNVPSHPRGEPRGYSKMSNGGLRHSHQHSKSSPSSERRNVHGYSK